MESPSGSALQRSHRLALRDRWCVARRNELMAKRPLRIELIEDEGVRTIVSHYANGEVVRKEVDPKGKPTRKPRMARLKIAPKNHTRQKRF